MEGTILKDTILIHWLNTTINLNNFYKKATLEIFYGGLFYLINNLNVSI
jgi:hypothetical protein